MPSTTSSTKHMTPHEAICDAAHRMIQGLDDNNAELLSSAFTPDATYDLRAFSFLGFDQVLSGQANIVSTLLSAVGHMDTTHMLSNFRTRILEAGTGEGEGDGGKAEMECYALAQHWRTGE
ncbi:Putative NTF2-like domain superfamily, SnoaL-like domain-containing protein [Septoria linicola]|uniref:NTF2-like domain superfamily, SnoaL-like domain-containing protein n=1 Tax=Septoria linicola TaxID=215465 RepID=A0A9Q9AQU3_9PEZI|nr:putative NTF2-like domain superfamily, SnoaL-like domain-containing protein [Septoria linicola]USW54037.1 Putative NTF2-like domain superfamily, SnoaL-like domain-containing protein [Septoria linicola]